MVRGNSGQGSANFKTLQLLERKKQLRVWLLFFRTMYLLINMYTYVCIYAPLYICCVFLHVYACKCVYIPVSEYIYMGFPGGPNSKKNIPAMEETRV